MCLIVKCIKNNSELHTANFIKKVNHHIYVLCRLKRNSVATTYFTVIIYTCLCSICGINSCVNCTINNVYRHVKIDNVVLGHPIC